MLLPVRALLALTASFTSVDMYFLDVEGGILKRTNSAHSTAYLSLLSSPESMIGRTSALLIFGSVSSVYPKKHYF
jgi:hypothetical protein